ncbi:uncharacterized protein PV07_05427 [Cladophialophora immunda]|uniref:Linalool dehydratase/isomerase domain-containing protein n=1 Tax=Cladophialophora immunda TaxID=569365 RepID=A0A0D2D1J0_9EURO|nr:uncharacterized protein PV07_05427 [Cladophialophora immunda]KIW29624.1 hypothetical protein PV07_05427 [Cladophialophora immunda]OQU94687.1 hypothetical protein CLAIMM_01016 [Cladophialophora immunda]
MATTTTTISNTSTLKISAGPPVDISKYPKLNAAQAGHLRHFHNLVSQVDGEWHHFGSLEAQQEWDDAYRYQLATMTYAAGVAHYHRLPAMRSAFKTLLRQMIHKMLRREVWGYWFVTSHGGKLLDPDLKELRKPWADPVIKENIMYSGHLLLMTSLYAMLFDDDEFEKEGSLTFTWNPLFWGLGREDFVYDNRSLQKVIFQQMEDNDWVGVCCEPNAVFVVCNQFPIIAMRYNDSRDGTNNVEDVLVKYKASLVRKGMLNDSGLYPSFFALKQRKALPARQGAHTAWANAYMNTWNSKQVHSLYDSQVLGFLTNVDGKTRLQPTRVALGFRKLVLENGEDAHSVETLRKAREMSAQFVNPAFPFETPSWSSFAQMLSELGKEKELADLLDYADAHLNPTWENGGLFYPRNDKLFDDDYNMVHMEPHSGNSGIGYSRLNVKDGQKKMWEKPWTKDILAQRPWVNGLSFADGVDFLRGVWDEEARAMIITMKSWSGKDREVSLTAENLPRGDWAVYVDGTLKQTTTTVRDGEGVGVMVVVGQDEVDVVVSSVY